MYNRGVIRTQIHLTEAQTSILDARSRATGASRSELIRRAIDAQYGTRTPLTREERLEALHASAGAWKDRNFTGEEYVRAIRSGDMNKNLRRLGA